MNGVKQMVINSLERNSIPYNVKNNAFYTDLLCVFCDQDHVDFITQYKDGGLAFHIECATNWHKYSVREVAGE